MLKTKKFALVLAAVMAASSLAACNGNNSNSSNSSSTPSSSTPSSSTASTDGDSSKEEDDGLPAVGDFSEKLKMKWYMCSDGTTYKEPNPVADALNERFNVEMSTLMVNGFDNDKMNVTLASGDIPDVFIRWGTQGYYEDGIIQPIQEEWIAKYMPKCYEIITGYDETVWNNATSSEDGALMGIPQISVTGDMVHTTCIREDWLEAVDLPMPKTIDELTEALRRFTFNDPDGDGQNNTYGMSLPGLHNNLINGCLPALFGAYGILPNKWVYEDDGSLTYGIISQGYKQALKQLHAWYAEGLIDPEWVTLDNGTYQNKITNGVIGFWAYSNPTYMNYSNPTSVPALTVANNPNAKLTYMEPLKGPDGKSGGQSDGPSSSWIMSFGAKASMEQVARAMQMAEAINTETDLFELTFFGVEGTTFTRNEDGSDAQIEGVIPQEYGCQVFRTASLFTWENARLQNPSAVVDLIQESAKWPSIQNVINTKTLSQTYDRDLVDSAEMSKLTLEFFFNTVTGEVDIDAEWDNYVSKWLELGGKYQVEGAQQMPVIK